MNEKLNWYNLQKNKCPKCNKDLMAGLNTQNIMPMGGLPDVMYIHPCGFQITESKYKQITTDRVNRQIETEMEGRGQNEEI